MLVSLNWLKKFIEIPKGFAPEDIGSKLTYSTVEVEKIEKLGSLLDNVVVGKVLEVTKHPNADQLKLVKVDIGREKIDVVCGGINLKEKMLVALAKVGARVKWHGQGEAIELKPAEIRGQKSNGMICASNEIGLERLVPCGEREIADLSGLKLKVGVSLAEALKLDDIVLEVDNKSMTHRPDLWGHYGLARDLAAVLKVKLNEHKTKEIKEGKNVKLKVEVKDKDKCLRYLGVVVENIIIGPSPEWLASQLEAVGVRSINNIVDITNYVMLELGQPMHAFDWRNVEGGKIVVETAKKGEKFTTLDGIERNLDQEMLLIKDGKKAVALAGIMGGLNSEIKDDTKTILFEAANFKAGNIRKTSVKLGLRSESSSRFEKGLDPLLAETAIRRAIELTLELIPEAKVASKVVDENSYTFTAHEIELNLEWLNSILGVTIEKQEVVDILERLQFGVKDKKDLLVVSVPSWRVTGDIYIPEDLAEEVARIYGYNNITPSMPTVALNNPVVNKERQLERKVKDILSRTAGFTESYNYSFVSERQLSSLGLNPKDCIALKNYLSEDQRLLSPSLVPNLLKNVSDNLRFFESFSLFELSRVFQKEKGMDIKRFGGDDKLPAQPKYLSGVVVGGEKEQPVFIVKGVLSSLLSELGVSYYFKKVDKINPVWQEKLRSLELVVAGEPLGLITELNRSFAARLDIRPAVGIFELNFSRLVSLVSGNKQYQPLPKYPLVSRDLAMVVDSAVSWEDVKKAVKKVGGDLIKEIELFDVYEGGKIEAGKKSLAFHLVYFLAERTLATEEVDMAQEKVVRELENKFGARVR